MDDIITLAYGSGGKKTSQLIEEIILPAFNNGELSQLGDGAVLKGCERLVFSTDSFVISPYFFPGGDIGKLAVCGTVNDICMCGGVPRYLSLSLIIEEGFLTQDLMRIINSISDTAKKCGVIVVTGDTKVVERGKGDGIFINTSGIGCLVHDGLGTQNVQDGDAVIITGTVGDHGAAIMSLRNNLISERDIQSDCQPLHRLSTEILKFGSNVKVMRDPTRGGLATTLNEFIEGSDLSILLDEEAIPYRPEVINICEILGLDPIYSANEGKIAAVVSSEKAEEIVTHLRRFPEGKDSAVIGRVVNNYKGKVAIKTLLGGTRIVSKLTGMQLPRIC